MGRRESRGLHRAYRMRNAGAIGVQYGMVMPSLVPSAGKVINASISNTSLVSRIRTLFPCFIFTCFT